MGLLGSALAGIFSADLMRERLAMPAVSISISPWISCGSKPTSRLVAGPAYRSGCRSLRRSAAAR